MASLKNLPSTVNQRKHKQQKQLFLERELYKLPFFMEGSMKPVLSLITFLFPYFCYANVVVRGAELEVSPVSPANIESEILVDPQLGVGLQLKYTVMQEEVSLFLTESALGLAGYSLVDASLTLHQFQRSGLSTAILVLIDMEPVSSGKSSYLVKQLRLILNSSSPNQ